MELFNSLIKETNDLLNGITPKSYPYIPSKAWKDIGSNELVLSRDAAFELGASGKGSANYILFTSSGDLVEKDEICVYGRDINAISSDSDFARIVILRVGALEMEDEAVYRTLKDIEFSKYHVYPEYHTSADNLDIISPDGLAGSYDVMVQCIEALEHNETLRITTIGEPKLGKYGLVPTMSSKETYQETLIIKDVCAYADGNNDLIRLSELIEKPVREIIPVLDKLKNAGLLVQVETE